MLSSVLSIDELMPPEGVDREGENVESPCSRILGVIFGHLKRFASSS